MFSTGFILVFYFAYPVFFVVLLYFLFIVSSFVLSYLFLFKSTDHCQRVETQLQ